MENNGTATMWIEPENMERHSGEKTSKLAWFLLGLGVGAGIMLLTTHKDQAKNLAGVAANKVRLRINTNSI